MHPEQHGKRSTERKRDSVITPELQLLRMVPVAAAFEVVKKLTSCSFAAGEVPEQLFMPLNVPALEAPFADGDIEGQMASVGKRKRASSPRSALRSEELGTTTQGYPSHTCSRFLH